MEAATAEDIEEIEDARRKLQTFAVEEYSNVARVRAQHSRQQTDVQFRCSL
jgi:hypothetical protein